MIKYKLTDQNMRTHNGFQWKIGKKFTTSGENDLCSSGWLHYYHHPLLAVLLNPIHARINNPLLFEVEAEGVHKDDKGRKGGCTEMTLIKQIDLPVLTTTQKIAFSILYAQKVYKEGKKWNLWANNWLNNTDRTKQSAYNAANAAAAANVDAAAAVTYAAAANAAAAAVAYAAAYADTDVQFLINCAIKCLEY